MRISDLHKFSPVLLTLLVFLLAQAVGSVLLVVIGMFVSPGFNDAVRAYINGDAQEVSMFDLLPVSLFALSLMAVNIIAVLICHFRLHYIRFVTSGDIASINWRPGMLGIVGGVLGAMSISVLTDNVDLPETMKQLSLAMPHDIWGVLALAIVGPITEELLFREAIEGEMLRREVTPWVAIIISALAFSIAHLNLAQGLYALPLGILFGIIYYKTGNIVLTSLLHILNNSIAAIQLYTMEESAEDITYADMFGSHFGAYAFMAISGVLCIVLIKFFWDSYRPCEETKKRPNLT
ncbi:MAG: CPBP family intramembrane metalloprotease [Bacteroidaceae bacterium]|nr:CPBP family intramembrane metalloprotease [Bacteroidaceae bacterium]